MSDVAVLIARILMITLTVVVGVLVIYGISRISCDGIPGRSREPRSLHLPRMRPTPPGSGLTRTNHEVIGDVELRAATTREFAAIAGHLTSRR